MVDPGLHLRDMVLYLTITPFYCTAVFTTGFLMMKTISGWLSLALLMVIAGPTAHAVDLAKVYEDALLADPTLKEAAANRMSTLESKPQALAALLPQFDGQYVYAKA